jgi:hypothetical protein
MLLLTTNIMMIICNIIRAKRVSSDVPKARSSIVSNIDDNNDDDNDDDDDDFVGTTNFYYLQLKIALSMVVVTSNLTN